MSALSVIFDGEPTGTRNWSRSQKPSGVGDGRVDKRTREFGTNSCVTILLAVRRGSSLAASCCVDIACRLDGTVAEAADEAPSNASTVTTIMVTPSFEPIETMQ